MARSICIQSPGAYDHVMARGNRREEIFHADEDRRFFLHTLSQSCEKTGWRVQAWVPMSNHYHLLIQTPEPNLVAGMSWRKTRTGLKAAGWKAGDVVTVKGPDPRKVLLTDLLWRRTAGVTRVAGGETGDEVGGERGPAVEAS